MGKGMKKTVLASFEVVSRHLPGGTVENHENLSQDIQCPGRDLNPGSAEHDIKICNNSAGTFDGSE
jgi:hypothetical protein